MTNGALADLTVIELGNGRAGAFAAKALADLDADVIKIEPPEGDPLRRAGPFPDDQPHPERSGIFRYLNANKRGVTLDVESEAGRSLLNQLLLRADILLSDLHPTRLDQLGLDYLSVSALNPRLIMSSVSTFGTTGPYRAYQGGDLIAWHMGGTGYGTPFNAVTDPEQQPPIRGGGYQAEYLAGWTVAAATIAAVFHRATYGAGQLVDVAAVEAVANMVRAGFAIYSHERELVARSRVKAGSPWIYPCKDGYISTANTRDHWWEAIKDLMGRPEWAESPLFREVIDRRRNADALDPLFSEWLLGYTRAELRELFGSRAIPCFPVNTIADLLRSPHYAARDYFVTQEHPAAGKMTQPGASIRFSVTPWKLRRPAPLLGEHNRELLTDQCSATTNAAPVSATAAGSAATPATDPVTGPIDQSRPLQGVRVLDFGWILSVPHCTAWLGTLGAEVIRVESMLRPDTVRVGLAGVADGIRGPNRSATFNGLNYSKQSVTINLATAEGLALARELVKISDVVTENFATGVFERLGLGYQALRELKPDIIMLTGSTLGATGPERDATGWGPNACAYGGLPMQSGYRDGPPADLGGIWPDYVVGTMMAFAVLGALHHQRRTGEGQYIELAMAEAVTAMIPEAVLDYSLNGRLRPRAGNRDEAMAPHGVFRCLPAAAPHAADDRDDGGMGGVTADDAWIAIAVAGDAEWQALCRVAARPEWARDPRFVTLAGRLAHEDELEALIGAWTRQQHADQLMQSLQAAGVAAVPVMNITDLMHDPHMQARRFIIEVDHAEVGPRTVAGLPAHFSAIPEPRYGPPPCIGAHNSDVLGGLLAVDPGRLQALAESKVLV